VLSGRELFLIAYRYTIRKSSRPDNTQTGTPDTHTNRGHMATNPKKTNDEAG
jgi:hypothetical protein